MGSCMLCLSMNCDMFFLSLFSTTVTPCKINITAHTAWYYSFLHTVVHQAFPLECCSFPYAASQVFLCNTGFCCVVLQLSLGNYNCSCTTVGVFIQFQYVASPKQQCSYLSVTLWLLHAVLQLCCLLYTAAFPVQYDRSLSVQHCSNLFVILILMLQVLSPFAAL